ncbi:hypothetical protein [Indibacter alkaliphilus]|nr:hypothetical protein [Indibacter alkaliphilus]
MKSNITSILVSLFLVLSLLNSCIENNENEVGEPKLEQVNPWQNFSNLKLEVYNAKKTPSGWIIVGRNGFLRGNDLENLKDPIPFQDFQTRLGRYRVPISSHFLATRTESEVFLHGFNQPNQSDPMKLSISNFDPNFIGFEDIPFWQGEMMGLTEGGVLLLSYRTAENNIAKDNPSFFIVNTETNNSKIEIKSTKIIDYPFISWFDNNYSIESFNEFFLVQVSGTTFKIKLNGEVTKLVDYPSKSLIKGDQLITMATDMRKGELSIFTSGLGTDNANKIVSKEVSIRYLNAEYELIGNRIIGYKNDEIFELNFDSGLNIKPLNNSNLKGNTITSIKLYENDKVLITSMCDKSPSSCGVFVTNLDNFK